MSQRIDLPIGAILCRVLLVGLVLARVAHVYQFSVGYFASPLDILDLRDGGWDFKAGVIAAWLYALHLANRTPALRKPLLAALLTTSVVWGTGSIALALAGPDEPRLEAALVATIDGRTALLTDYKGKPSAVNLWATWCGPCQREMPMLQKAQADHPEVNFVFLNQGEPAAKVRGYLADRGLTIENVLLDPKGTVSADFSSRGLPTTLFYDARGLLVDTHLGELSREMLDLTLARMAPPARSAPVPR